MPTSSKPNDASTDQSNTQAPIGRRALKREQTRSRLIDSARTLMAERGVDNVGIAEITEGANVGTGTFYNYFIDRDQLLQAVAEDAFETVGSALDQSLNTLEDPAELFACSLRHLVQYSLHDRIWGGLLVQMGAAHPILMRVLGPCARRDLLLGIDTGRFTIEDVDLATTCTFGSLIAAINMALSVDQNSAENMDEMYAASMLRMVGVPADEAGAISKIPLPEITSLRAQ
ncbi:transcriptional regulator [Corynebacterium suranareeae]|uniref:Transcriptional regulator n=1 Tax=Corynebacterium suranareeae TaxID=2506452 RepID=A0A160PNU4_9CORY|nr:TetR/AcrR family transcriptional regulator [Corynebacterium suranareeae]BAU95539.1 transcriptional regulator [Corynebacterium suranareeae]